ncbi:hypothetical protein HYR54_08750 [Candidatus Acetothermia bacterium]|nr:hypothetical protein [Candidatus Acetothermia bacterium]MBI3459994.1 hypothetical protein [Candidatus Acetothermia bacterium]MBI3659396.1 hypothetical protein [Candidatus Acetothermia bacterium]
MPIESANNRTFRRQNSISMANSKMTHLAQIVCPAPTLTVLLVKDDGYFMAKCPELDLVTEMDKPQEALHAMVEMIREYAEDYHQREQVFLASPNRAHHKPYVDSILACRDEWAVWELLEVRHARIHLPTSAKRAPKARI